MRASWLFSGMAGAVLVAAPLAGQEPAMPVSFSGNVSITSDYTFRGISQTYEEMAIQGGIDASGPSGLYVGVWGSNLNFGEGETTSPAQRAQAEIDVYGGIGATLGGTDMSAGIIYYGYPGTPEGANYSFIELNAGLSRALGPVSAGISAAWSPDYFAASGSSVYVGGSLDVAIPESPFGLSAGLGYQTIELNDAFGTPNYMDWSAGVSLGVMGVDLGASFVGTDLETEECFGGSDLCDPRLVLSLGLGM